MNSIDDWTWSINKTIKYMTSFRSLPPKNSHSNIVSTTNIYLLFTQPYIHWYFNLNVVGEKKALTLIKFDLQSFNLNNGKCIHRGVYANGIQNGLVNKNKLFIQFVTIRCEVNNSIINALTSGNNVKLRKFLVQQTTKKEKLFHLSISIYLLLYTMELPYFLV